MLCSWHTDSLRLLSLRHTSQLPQIPLNNRDTKRSWSGTRSKITSGWNFRYQKLEMDKDAERRGGSSSGSTGWMSHWPQSVNEPADACNKLPRRMAELEICRHSQNEKRRERNWQSCKIWGLSTRDDLRLCWGFTSWVFNFDRWSFQHPIFTMSSFFFRWGRHLNESKKKKTLGEGRRWVEAGVKRMSVSWQSPQSSRPHSRKFTMSHNSSSCSNYLN